jgi:hypothetical protein
MTDRVMAFFVFIAAVPLIDFPAYKRMPFKGAAIYVLLMITALYLGYIFVTGAPLPNITDLISFVYGRPAEALMRMFKA